MALLPLFPTAVRRMRVAPGTRFILSSDASVVKGLAYPPGTPHVCYCHSPPRYLFDMHETYARQTAGLGALGRLVFRFVTPYVRRFDYAAAQRVTLKLTGVTFGTSCCTSAQVSITNPSGSTLLAPTFFGTSGKTIALQLPATGSYSVLIDPQSNATGNATLTLTSP